MPVTLTLAGEVDLRNIRLLYGPLAEAAVSLHVLADPKHHPLHTPWVRRCRSLTPELRREVRALRPAFDFGLPGFLCPAGAERDADVGRALDAFDDLAPDVLFYELAARVIVGMPDGPATPAEALRRCDAVVAATDDRPRREMLVQALEDPAALADRIRTLLAAYWDEAFRDEWLRIRSTIDAAASGTAQTLSSEGLTGVLKSLHPEVTVDASGRRAVLARPFDLEIELDETTEARIHVSYYLWPHVWASVDQGSPLALGIPTTPPHLPAVSHRPLPELVASLRALGDPTRLNLLRLVADAPRSTQELARFLHMSEPGVSRHLTTLARAGLVRGRREGHYVVYDVNQGALEPLAESLLGYISPPGD